MPAERCILHVDMDAFFASVEQLDHPEWRGKALVVGGDGNRGVVAAASYEVRKFGVHSAMPMAQAKRLCPHVIVAKGRYWRYSEISKQIRAIFYRYTPIIQPLSIDEAFLDVTDSLPLFGPGETIATRIKADVKQETGVTCSVGVAPNKFLAKLASDLQKPDGLSVLTAANIGTILPPLPIEKMWGVGPVTAQRLRGMGVRTFGDLATISVDLLRPKVGEDAHHWQKLARGEDDREVSTERVAKSVGQEQTFGENLRDPDAVRTVILEQCQQVAERLRKSGQRARSVTLKIRYGDFQTITRRCTMEQSTDATLTIWTCAKSLFDRWASESFKPVRLIGTQAGDLDEGPGQFDLFTDHTAKKHRAADTVADRINQKLGDGAIKRLV